jgi:hypothetical protein
MIKSIKEAEKTLRENPDIVLDMVRETYLPKSYTYDVNTKKGKWGYEPFKEQKEIHFDGAQIRTLACGRRWGKSHLGAKETEVFTVASSPEFLDMPLQILIAAPEKGQTDIIFEAAEENIRQGIRSGLIKLQVTDYSTAKKEYRFLRFNNGTLIRTGSGKNENTLVGFPIDFLVGDEWAYMIERIWSRVFASLSTKGRLNKALFMSSPNGTNFFYDLFCEGQNTDDGKHYRSWQSPSWISPYCDKEFIERAERTMSKMLFDQEFGAEFQAFFGKVFTELTRAQNVVDSFYRPDLPLYFSMDFGKNFPVLEVFQVDGRIDPLFNILPTVYQIDEFNPRGVCQIQDLYSAILDMEKKYRKPDEYFGDRAGSYTNSTGYSDINYLKSNGINVRYCTDPFLTRIPEGIKLINAWVKNAAGEVRFFITKNCIRAIEDMERIKYPTNKDGIRTDNRPEDDNYHIHSIDTKRYFFINLFGKLFRPERKKRRLILLE